MPTYSAIHVGLAAKVHAEIVTLTPAGVPASSIRFRRKPYADDFGSGEKYDLPGVLVMPGNQERIEPADNLREDFGYPVTVVFLDGDGGVEFNAAGDDAWWHRRQQVIDRFRAKTLDITDPVAMQFRDCRVEPGAVMDWQKALKEKFEIGVVTLRFFARRQRPA